MMEWLHAAVDLVGRNPDWALALVFVAATIEAVIVIGTFLPAPPFVLAVASAAAASGQSLWPYLAAVFVGSILGDLITYRIGARCRDRIRGVWPLSRAPGAMDAAERFFARWGTASILLCRFVPIMRSAVPTVAGMAGMDRRRFLGANIVSAATWAPVHVFPAQLAGSAAESMLRDDWRMAVWWAVGLAAVGVGCWVGHRVLAARLRRAG